MLPPTHTDVLLLMILSLFSLGAVAFLSGIAVLLTRSLGKDIRAITRSTRQVAQKALAHDITGLVGNASMLLTAANDMVRTGAGIGAFLLLLGSTMMLIAIALFIYFFGGARLNDIPGRLP